VVRVLRSPLDAASCALFPSRCRLCDEPLLHLSAAPVCLACWQQLSTQTAALCTLCGEALGLQASFRRIEQTQREDQPSRSTPFVGEALCELCQRQRPAFARAAAYGEYAGTLRALIHLLKYEHVTTVAAPLGAHLAQAIRSLPNLPSELTVVAVPLHPIKERQRGFNQTILLAEQALQALRQKSPSHQTSQALRITPALRALGRQRATESQSGLTSHERRRNLRGAFFVAESEKIAGRAVLLLDDIYTTGATARECTRVLLAAGASAVYVATLARSQREGVAYWDAPALPRAGQASQGVLAY